MILVTTILPGHRSDDARDSRRSLQAAAAQQNLEFPDIQFGGNTNISKLGQATFTTLNMMPYSHIIRPDMTKVFSTSHA